MTETEKSQPIKGRNGLYRENFNANWYAQYFEDAATGLRRTHVYKHATPEWQSVDHLSLEEARGAARHYYNRI